MSDTKLTQRLSEDTASMGIALTPEQARQLIEFLRLLQRWSRRFNLSSVTGSGDILRRHLLDSLAVLPYLNGPRILDAGTGAGLPGIPLAVLATNHQFVLLDARVKRVRFVRHVAGVLGLRHVEVLQARVEGYRPGKRFDTVLARAFAPLDRLVELAGPQCATGGRLLAMKGRLSKDELAAIPPTWMVHDTHALMIPGLRETRHLVELGVIVDDRGSARG